MQPKSRMQREIITTPPSINGSGFALSTMGRSRGGGQEGEVAVTPAALEALPWPTPERPIKQKLIPQLVSFC
jgi:hypothetical protein